MFDNWQQMFHDGMLIFGRSAVSILFLFFATKMIGKRQLSQMTFFEYTVGITIGSIAAFLAADLDGAPISHSLISITTFALFPILIGLVSLKSKRVRDFVEGKARVLIKKGKIMEENLGKERMTADELIEQLRLKNAFRISDVEFAMMEPSGKISVLLKAEKQPLTAETLGVNVRQESSPETVIMDGTLMKESLQKNGVDETWLRKELDQLGLTEQDIFLAQLNGGHTLHIDLYDDAKAVPAPHRPKQKYTYAALKKCQADLEMFALLCHDEAEREHLEREAGNLQAVIDRIAPMLTKRAPQ